MNLEAQTCSCISSNQCASAETPLDAAKIILDYQAALRRHIERIIPTSDVEDVTQEVLVKVSKKLRSFQGRSNLSTWLFQVATRTALDHLKSRQFQQGKSTLSIDAPDVGSPTGTDIPFTPATRRSDEAQHRLIVSEMNGCVREYLDQLPPEYRDVLKLKDIEGLKNREVAGRLGISLEAAKIRLHRARKAMKGLLNDGCDFYRTEDNVLACDRKTSVGDSSGSCSC